MQQNFYKNILFSIYAKHNWTGKQGRTNLLHINYVN